MRRLRILAVSALLTGALYGCSQRSYGGANEITKEVTLRLPLEIKDLFREWLADARPDRAARVMSLVRQTRGGKDYDADWSQRMKGPGPVAELIATRFKAALKRYGLDAPRKPLVETQFRVPGNMKKQLDLFDLPPHLRLGEVETA